MPIHTKKVYGERKEWLEDYKTYHRVLSAEEQREQEQIHDYNTEYAKIEQQCINEDCDSNQCYFYTQQIRSADEGQTIFYRCVKCK
jgi:DNA-directed RNA polymerase subunit M/transcription elongation factor TFIIS